MISVVELLAVVVLAIGLAQGVARLVQMVPSLTTSRRVSKVFDNEVGRASWGETTSAHFHYVRRRTRYQVNCPVRYEVEGKTQQGAVVDMSREGWRVKGNTYVEVGTEMSLIVSLPGGVAPTTVSRAVVRWSDRTEFGIGLVALDPRSAVQLSEFFSSLTTLSQAKVSAA